MTDTTPATPGEDDLPDGQDAGHGADHQHDDGDQDERPPPGAVAGCRRGLGVHGAGSDADRSERVAGLGGCDGRRCGGRRCLVLTPDRVGCRPPCWLHGRLGGGVGIGQCGQLRERVARAVFVVVGCGEVRQIVV